MEDFLVYDWSVTTQDHPIGEDYVVAWCIDRQSQPTCFVIKGVHPTVAMKIPAMTLPHKTWPHYLAAVKKSLDIPRSYILDEKVLKRRYQYYYSEGHPYLVITAKTQVYAEKIQGIMRTYLNDPKGYDVHMDPSLESVLIRARRLNSQGWNRFNMNRSTEMGAKGIARSGPCYLISMDDIESCSNVYPVSPLLAAYDIETKGEDHRFSDYGLISDYICAICYETWHYKQYESTVKSYVIMIGKPSKVPDHIILYAVDNEEQLVQQFEDLIRETSPIMITSYNGDGFDMAYLHGRKGRCLKKTRWDVIGKDKYVHARTYFTPASMQGRFRSGYLLRVPGIVSYDVFKHFVSHVKRRQYKLKDVARDELGDTKVDIGDYKFINRACKKAEQGDYSDLELLLEYVAQDVSLTSRLFEKHNMFDFVIEHAQACSETWWKFIKNGNMSKTKAMMYQQALLSKPPVMLSINRVPSMFSSGGLVQDPKIGMFTYVNTFDYTSLYPSIMIAFDVDYLTILSKEESKLPFATLLQRYPSIESPENIRWVRCEQANDVYLHAIVKYHRKVMNKDQPKPLIPELLKSLLDRRKVAKKMMEAAEDPEEARKWNIRQLALKITANAVYGSLNAPGNTSLSEAAQIVTALGRMAVTWVADALKREFGVTIIYGDTDSVMVRSPQCKSCEEAFVIGRTIEAYLNRNLPYLETDAQGRIYCIPESEREGIPPKPLSVAFENQSLLQTHKKKLYAKVYVDANTNKLRRNPDGSLQIEIKGLVPVRRDNSKAHSRLYYRLIESSMEGMSLGDALAQYYEEGRRVYYGCLASNEYAISTQLGREKQDDVNNKMGEFVRRLASEGKSIEVGHRFEYYYCTDPSIGLMTDQEFDDNRAEWDLYEKRQGPMPTRKLQIDRSVTLDKMGSSIDTFFSIAYKESLATRRTQRSWNLFRCTCEDLYGKYGGAFLQVLASSHTPYAAIGCSPYAKIFRTAYRTREKHRPIVSELIEPSRGLKAILQAKATCMDELRRRTQDQE